MCVSVRGVLLTLDILSGVSRTNIPSATIKATGSIVYHVRRVMGGRTRNLCLLVVKPVILAACALLALRTTLAPSPRAATSDGGFSVQRALEHVRAIAVQPHPTGSVANERVRSYLLERLNGLSMEPKVLPAQVRDNLGRVRTVNNIEARLRGSAPELGGTLMLAAHYDSVPAGPGASDDGAAVGAILETLRALRAAKPLRQDVLVIISDGEELGLRGAEAYIEAHGEELKSDVALVLNFDARGTSGPSIMYENAPGNLELIRHFARAAPCPIANSLAYDVSRMLPNGSDFMVYRRLGLKGLNFAFINRYFNYHTDADTVENLDPASLYHDGTYALHLTRHFADMSAAELSAITAAGQGDAVYFNLTPSVLARYSSAWIWPLSGLGLLATVLAVVIGWRRRHVTGLGLLEAFARLVLALLLVPAAVYGLMQLVRSPRSPAAFDAQVVAVFAVSIGVTLALASVWRWRATSADIGVSAAVLFALLMIPVNVYVPGGSFLFAWPLLFLACGLLAAMRPGRGVWMALAVAPAVWLWTPLLVMLFSALTLRLAPMCAVGVALATWACAVSIGRDASRTPDNR
jgi:hypothetical protein